MNKLQKFIEDNDIELDGSGSDLNGNCVILAGYALYLGGEDWAEALDAIDPDGELSGAENDEFERVFKFAEENDYGRWWESEEAKRTYKF